MIALEPVVTETTSPTVATTVVALAVLAVALFYLRERLDRLEDNARRATDTLERARAPAFGETYDQVLTHILARSTRLGPLGDQQPDKADTARRPDPLSNRRARVCAYCEKDAGSNRRCGNCGAFIPPAGDLGRAATPDRTGPAYPSEPVAWGDR